LSWTRWIIPFGGQRVAIRWRYNSEAGVVDIELIFEWSSVWSWHVVKLLEWVPIEIPVAMAVPVRSFSLIFVGTMERCIMQGGRRSLMPC